MNIQIFGTKKSFDTKKAQRYFKERRVKFQFIDLKEKGMSKGELESVARAVGGIDAVIDPKAKDADTVALVQYLAADQKFEKVLDNQQILREPIVRNGRQATVGDEPDVWRGWELSGWVYSEAPAPVVLSMDAGACVRRLLSFGRSAPAALNNAPRRRRTACPGGAEQRAPATWLGRRGPRCGSFTSQTARASSCPCRERAAQAPRSSRRLQTATCP